MRPTSNKQPSSQLLDMLPSISKAAKKVALTGGTGDGWTPRLAFNPCDELNLKGTEAAPEKLMDFISQNRGKLLIGYISYDFGCKLHEMIPAKPSDPALPDIYFLAYDNYLEESKGNLKIIGQSRLPLLNKPVELSNDILTQDFQETTTKKDYGAAFDKTIEYIKSGHVYQLNLSHRLQAKTDQNPRLLFARVAGNNQASMMGYLEGDDFQLLSVSPERFVKIHNRLIKTMPIKGTMSTEETAAKEKLLNDPKEKSELSMITDLLRNDLAKVSEVGSVKVTSQRATQYLTSVIHTYSEISGKLKTGITPIEALLSMSPGGSITGCPKRRAMQVIDELEPFPRGAYCGSLVCISPDGSLDSSILIRTIIKQGQDLTLPVGGGIVFDSNKDREYQETLDKAKSIVDFLE